MGQEPFEVIIDALGSYAVSFIPDVHLVRIYSDDQDRTAHLEICLHDGSWERQSAAIDSMVEIRAMYLNELSISYEFDTETDDELSESARAGSQVFATHSR